MKNFKIETMKNDGDQIRYTAKRHEGVLVYGKQSMRTKCQGVNYFKSYKFDLYEGYVYVECNQNYCGDWYLTAYTNIAGNKITIHEQKHWKNRSLIDSIEDAIMESKRAIGYLTNYIVNYLDVYIAKKPRVSSKIKSYKFTPYPERIFSYKGNEYVFILGNYIPCLIDINPQGNEMFRVV